MTASANVSYVRLGKVAAGWIYTLEKALVTYHASGTDQIKPFPERPPTDVATVSGSGTFAVGPDSGSGAVMDTGEYSFGGPELPFATKVWQSSPPEQLGFPKLDAAPGPDGALPKLSPDLTEANGGFTSGSTAEGETHEWNLHAVPGRPFRILVDKDIACPNVDFNFRIDGDVAGRVEWSGGGTPAAGVGPSFTTRFSDSGDHTIEAILTEEAGVIQFDSKSVHITKPSGGQWSDVFGHSRETKDLREDFRKMVEDFLDALDGHVNKHVSSTYRTDEHQYLMHYADKILDGTDPAKVPPWPGVDICWDHHGDDGQRDLAASRAAAQQMKEKMNFGDLVAPPGKSNHQERIAVDLKISWEGDVTLDDGTVLHGGTGNAKIDAFNADLVELGKSCGVLKHPKNPTEWMHWSIDGH